jgi:hypothetical protein
MHAVRRRVRRWVYRQRSWLVSLCFHAALLALLALLVVPRLERETLVITFANDWEENLGLEDVDELVPTIDLGTLLPDDQMDALVDMSAIGPVLPEVPVFTNTPSRWEPTGATLDDLARLPSTDAGTSHSLGGSAAGGVAGRRGRRASAGQRGATKASEQAVELALKWLAAHQESDGSWNFDLQRGRCGGRCRHSGSAALASNGATALAVLPFLGAGNTHERGPYRQTVGLALEYLLNHQAPDGSFHEPQGTMYSHGLAALAICEATTMTRDESSSSSGKSYRRRPNRALPQKRIASAAQSAIDFIVYSQHSGGGWRYMPRQPGDTSVVGWQAMALQSGRMGRLYVPDATLKGIGQFLDSVGCDHYGATYGYMTPTVRPATTAVGLLSRMYLGWKRSHPGITNGVEHLSRLGPSRNDVYYNYYATQVMHHFQGPLWKKWNLVMREHLVHTQAKEGHECGSWYFDGDFGSNVGGRLYITAMSAMVLEVYYRHMPIYSSKAVGHDEDWTF